MFGEGFVEIDSLIHRLDPRVKIVAVLLFSVVVAVSIQFITLVSALALGLCFVLLAKLSIRQITHRLVPVNIFVLFLWVFLPFTVNGGPHFFLGPLVGSHEGILLAARITLKSNAIVLVLIVLISSTSVLTLGHGMHEMKVPRKIVHLFFFTYRYVFVIHREYLRLKSAIKVRGFLPGTNLHTYKTFAYLVGMLLVRSSERAERVNNAMLCRGFRGKLYSLSTFSLKAADSIFLAVMLIFILALGVLEWATMA